jgi:hypothetical protein
MGAKIMKKNELCALTINFFYKKREKSVFFLEIFLSFVKNAYFCIRNPHCVRTKLAGILALGILNLNTNKLA